LDDPESVIERKVGIEPPPQILVKLLRSIDIRDGDYDRFKFQVNSHALPTLYLAGKAKAT
jgi:hypothetical protein